MVSVFPAMLASVMPATPAILENVVPAMQDIEDDDAMFAEYASAVSVAQQSAGGAAVQDRAMSKNVVAFLEKRFGSVSHFYTDTEHTKTGVNGFDRLENLRRALNALDRGGWERSYHQRVFHESFINAVVRVLFKTDPPGFFSQSYPRILELNSWSSIHQEILISTPRRFGKTISVCLFVAALIFACPRIEISIYSTCACVCACVCVCVCACACACACAICVVVWHK